MKKCKPFSSRGSGVAFLLKISFGLVWQQDREQCMYAVVCMRFVRTETYSTASGELLANTFALPDFPSAGGLCGQPKPHLAALVGTSASPVLLRAALTPIVSPWPQKKMKKCKPFSSKGSGVAFILKIVFGSVWAAGSKTMYVCDNSMTSVRTET